ncbi:class II fructose-bisphosphate aldolase [Sphaerochaeta sp.]|uniref:class II fructose-bisphosphate aldolase n=1 Tax=Sphaerochaeta sp. TaxID=1972642 RepID=UPI002FC96E70
MIRNLAEVLAGAEASGYAVGSFNGYDYLTFRATVEASRELGFPAIIAFGAAYLKNMSVEEVASVFRQLATRTSQDVVLHLDHCKDFAAIVRAIKAGFTSVMYDGSALPFEENLARTAQVVAVAHAAGVSVEAELGSIAGGDKSHEGGGEEIYTNPELAKRFAEETGIDALAVSIGTVHGLYKGEPKISIETLRAIDTVVPVPLVLHGGSGTPEQTIKQCIAHGIRKINVNTEISVAVLDALQTSLSDTVKQAHLSQLMLGEMDVMKQVVIKYMRMFRP